jgi:hypothetical protein
MNNKYKSFLIFMAAIVISGVTFLQFEQSKKEDVKFEKERSTSSPKAGIKGKKARWDYFFNMLRDPATNKIPAGIRTKELEFAKKLNEEYASLNKFTTSALTWSEAGPNNVGGRTRALAVDVTNPNTIIAGAVSGGIWKSTDNGNSWILKSSSATILSVTAIAQDPRPGFTSTWYYTTGEMQGSAGNPGSDFTGDGIYKSTDNGESWSVLPSTLSSNLAQWDSDFDNTLNIKVSPINGYIFVATNGAGIFRSTDGGATFTNVLGGVNHHVFSDIDIASNGNLLAILSRSFGSVTPTNSPGLYKSVNHGDGWTNIPLSGYPATAQRSVIDIAPSNPNVAYLMTFVGTSNGQKENILFYKINVSGSSAENRSNNLPDFSSQEVFHGYIYTQGNYNMAIAVKPDDENFVMIAGTCMFRSTNGFATKPNDKKTSWIGGYSTQTFASYPNFHSDVHSFSFDPTDPKKMWWGHDGGLTYTTDITNTTYPTFFPWEDKNNGYNVTQFYHISMSSNSDSRIMGGTQDNGTPFFNYNGSIANMINDASSGDGAYSYFAQNFAYTSSQQGYLLKLRYDGNNNPQPPYSGFPFSIITPTGATNQLFINPFEVDPNNEDIMYYPAGNVLWRNNQLSSIPINVYENAPGWTKLDNLTVPTGYALLALSASRSPAHILYYGAWSQNAAPKIFKLTNSNSATSGAVEISIPGAPSGSYISNIAINPDDANEILVVLSNYNIVGLYHSTNGGQSYTAVEGNLEGTEQNPGPSLRAATILPGNSGKTYYLATSIGVFSTTQLNGNSTVWTPEGQNVLGNVVVHHITSRKSDGRVLAGTHGRGAFVGSGGGGGALLNVNIAQLNMDVYPGQTRTREFSIINPGGAPLSFNVNASGGPTANKSETPNMPNLYPFSTAYEMNNMLREEALRKLKADFVGGSKSVITPLINPAVDELILDDGDGFPNGFWGLGGGVHFYWRNDFQLTSNFDLEKVKYYMKTEASNSNPIRIAVVANEVILYDTIFSEATSQNGKWYEFQFPQYILNSLKFQNGNTFTLIVASLNTAIGFPAAYDDEGLKPGFSHAAYDDPFFGFSGWFQLAGNAAFLIRAVGNSGGGGQNQAPVAVAQVSPNPAGINQSVNFNGSGSHDPDGQITNYAWNFGDGQTSTQMIATHSYSEAGQFNYTLTVTDNGGATNQTGGQITISDQPSRWTIEPASGNVPAGSSQNIRVTFNAQGLAEGNYQAQLNITSNGGNMTIPIAIFISTTVDVEEDDQNILSYRLNQNYPNPFNPSTKISWSIPVSGLVSLKIYNIEGSEVETLINEYKSSGNHEVIFDSNKLKNGSSLPSGVYFYRLTSGNYSESKKFILLK